MSMAARIALLLFLSFGLVRVTAAEDIASLRAKASRGNALAQYNLGLAYTQGRIVAADPAEAFLWLTLASESGATGKALDSLLGKITDEQLAEGRRRLGAYRTALAAQNASATAARNAQPKLAPRGFTLAPPPGTPPAKGETPPAAAVAKAPEAVTPPISTSPAEGSDLVDLGHVRRELEKTRADLQAAQAAVAALRAHIAGLEKATAEARANEARATAELAAAQQQLATAKAVSTAALGTDDTSKAAHRP